MTDRTADKVSSEGKKRTSGRTKGRQNDDPDVKLSKSLSYVLRHGAEKVGLELQEDGYASLIDLLKLPNFQKHSLSDIQRVVDNNDKKRYTLTKDEQGKYWIRANQGHSLKVKNLELEEITDPSLYPNVIHGTYLEKWKVIAESGLSKMSRNHIHFASGLVGEEKVISGMRRNCTVFIYVDLKKALEDKVRFFKSSNGVILSEGIDGILPVKYFSQVLDSNGASLL
ncbi:putative tRNA 2'-phosphotransferase [Basidiobolus meristosporus CBS 931.73]|uniref:2'-phosphotransferase n=1 Tax=Basidiobolus meristosporus CBS 931.73 TaxID=1314790 RepID=A0A1Y1Y2M6_9FUNG|nr:putative tRNA 2'-phosphotransferase [Basidiobolus meristosporus CBS 931.73]|eukprot:ORX92135.1 putative tRNA 2'-phosphotransferase [Basidiobolus meristosporus CBS 931.73]